jgi:predicted nucleotidyltransferase
MKDLLATAQKIHCQNYGYAEFIILSGSIIRGEGTATSDLDIVVVYESLPAAFRESYFFDGLRVEAFIHDLSTLKYFMYTVDYGDSRPVMATMIDEGIVVPQETDLSVMIQALAREHLQNGPAPASKRAIDGLRYSISNLLDDLVDSRNRYEQIATACTLYDELAKLYFASKRVWQGGAKSTVRAMHKHDPAFSNRFHDSFDLLFREGDAVLVVKIAEELLHSVGGYLFDGYRVEANPNWRL